MAMNGHVVYTGGDTRMVFNKDWDYYMTWSTQHYGPNAIQKNGHIWVSNINDSRVCVLDTMATVLHQLSITGTTLIQIIADTSDHIYLVYKDHNVVNSFGVIRYGASFVPDWHYLYPGSDALEAKWGIDQRLYVTCSGRVVVLDANGNRLKDLMGVGGNYTVYQDHGLGIVSSLADTVRVVRTDSNMAVRWAKKFAPDTQLLGQPFTVDGVAGIAAPGSHDMVITATCQVQVPSTNVCTYTYSDEIYTILLDASGTIQAVQNGQSQFNKRHYSVRSSPYGDPLISYGVHSCLLSAHIETRMLRMVPGYDIRQSCTGIVPAATAQNYVPSSLPSVGALGTRTAGALAIGPDNTSFGAVRLSSVVNAGSTICAKPCLQVSANQLGGGQVAFDDDTYGFYTITYDFGDGSTGNTNDPVHTYPPYGTYPVTVIATNGCGADTFHMQLHACTTAQVAGPSNLCMGGSATYTETSGLNSANLSWLVDGVPAGSGSSFNWTPSAPGTYTLSAVYVDLPCRDTNNRTIVVHPAPPSAGFTYSVTGLRQLTFTNTSTSGVSYQWSFGDGGTSTAVNPVWNYSTSWANNGNFTICLIATNPCGSDTFCYNFSCPIPYASFSIPSTNALTASITSAALNGNLSWDFGDGSTATGAVSSHTFPAPGTYNVCQTVSNACASHSTCLTVLVDSNSTASYREHLATGYDQNVHAIAAQPSGDVLVAVSNSNSYAALLPLDPGGAVRGPLNTWTGSNAQVVDLHAMPNGNFAFFGQTLITGSSLDPFWGEVNKFGNLVQAYSLPIGTNGQLTRRAFQLPSGYLLIAYETAAPQNNYYIKLDHNLQVQYARYAASKIFGGVEAPDGSVWLVQQPNSLSANLEFVHLDAAGIGFEKYSTAVPFSGSSAAIQNALGMGIDCDGNLYGMVNINVNVPSAGVTYRIGVFRFQTLTHDVETRLYRVGSGPTATGSVYTPVINTLAQYPNGHWMGWGNVLGPNGVVSPPSYEKLLLDLDPSTFTLSAAAFGQPGSVNNQEQVIDAYVAGPGHAYTLSKTGLNAKPLEVHRHSNPTDCQLPASALAPVAVVELSNTSATYSNAAIASTAITAPAASWTRVPGTTNASSLLQCTGSCPSGLTAGFTHTVSGNTLTLTSTATPGAMLAWSIPGQTCATGSNSLTLNLPCGTYPVTLTASDQCGTAIASQVITIGTPASLSLGPDQLLCPGTATTLTASTSFNSYLWSNGATTASISVTTPGTYSLTATDIGGCVSADTVLISNHPAPSVSAGPDQALCIGASATFSATAGMSSYLWNTGATSASITVTAPGTYAVTATDANGCTAADTATLSNYPAPSVSAGPDQAVCIGASATFSATAGMSSYLWSTGATNASITVSAPGTYAVTATDANGCTAGDTVVLSNHPASSVSVGPDQAVCIGASATFSATAGMSSYLWSTGATSASITVTAPGTYAVTATDANGCTAADTATLSNFPSPAFSLGPDTSFCADTTWALAGPGGMATYLWSTGATTQGIASDTTGTYSLTVTDMNGCTASDTIQLLMSQGCVWPGDANHDSIADNADLLALAYGMGATGPARANANLSWYGQPAADWSLNLPLGANYKHLDCDGNGTLQLADTAAITMNFGLTHNKTGGLLGGIPAWIEPELDSFPVGDTVFFLVHWGDAGIPVTLGHGIAFTLQIAPAHVTPGTLYGRFPNSFLGNGTSELATMTIPIAGSGYLPVAISRQDRIGRSGHGAIMRVGFLPDQVLPLTANLGYVPVNITGIVAVDGDYAPVLCSGQGDSILIYDPVNSTTPSQSLVACSLFPVPASDVAYLDVRLVQDADVAVELTDLHGRKLTTLQGPAPMQAGRHRIAIPTDQLSDGVYFVRLVVGETSKVMKLVVAK